MLVQSNIFSHNVLCVCVALFCPNVYLVRVVCALFRPPCITDRGAEVVPDVQRARAALRARAARHPVPAAGARGPAAAAAGQAAAAGHAARVPLAAEGAALPV